METARCFVVNYGGAKLKLALGWVSGRKSAAKSGPADSLVKEFAERAGRLCATELVSFGTEAALLEWVEKAAGRQAAILVVFDSRGEALTSEEFARYLGRLRDEGAQRVVFAIGPADGWAGGEKGPALGRAQRTISLGRMTLPHELARVVVAEQVYRALTILAGHPYHCGH